MPTLRYGVDIGPPGSERHDNLLEKIKDCTRMSQNVMNKRHENWTKNESLFKAYTKETPDDSKRRKTREQGLPQYTTIVIPYSYAIAMTAVTYWSQVFMGRSPIFQYAGRNQQSERSTQAVEAVIDYQMQVGRNIVPLYVWLMDKAKYGFGVVCHYWTEEIQTVSKIELVPKKWAGFEIPGTERPKVVTQDVRSYAGNKLFNVRPFDFLPDTRVSLVNFQNGEFCGRKIILSMADLKKRASREEFFNLKYVEEGSDITRFEDGSPANLMPTGDGTRGQNKASFRCVEMVLDLIPSEWGLEGGNRPQKWIFTVVGEQVIVGARPQQANHGQFPYDVITYDINGYEVASFSLLDTIRPLNDVVDWLINTHFFAVRKSLNGNIIVDPSMVNMDDLTNPQPGRVVRLKAAAAGRDPRTVWSEMAQSEPTQMHLSSLGLFDTLFQRVSGVSENIQGQMSKGRKTAAEVRTTTTASTGRMKLNCEWDSALGFSHLASMLLSNTQQNYSWEETFRIAGQIMESREFINVTPETLAGNFDYIPVDGDLPLDRTGQAALWKELMMMMFQAPALAASYDMTGIFSYVAQLAGMKNIDQFRVQVTPDTLAMAALKSGDIQGLPGAAGSMLPGGSGYSGDSPTAAANPMTAPGSMGNPGVNGAPGLMQ